MNNGKCDDVTCHGTGLCEHKRGWTLGIASDVLCVFFFCGKLWVPRRTLEGHARTVCASAPTMWIRCCCYWRLRALLGRFAVVNLSTGLPGSRNADGAALHDIGGSVGGRGSDVRVFGRSLPFPKVGCCRQHERLSIKSTPTHAAGAERGHMDQRWSSEGHILSTVITTLG